MQAYRTMGVAELLVRAQQVLGVTQEQLGALIGGYSRRTIIRWQRRGTPLIPPDCENLARACHPHDRELAACFAERGGHTLVSLGLERPPAPPAPLPAPPVPLPSLRRSPSPRHLSDSVVCAAAEAMPATPQQARPAVVAAFERAVALGMTAEEALAGMRDEPPAPARADKARRGAQPPAK